MKVATDEAERRRTIQHAYNEEHGITPKSTVRAILDMHGHEVEEADYHDLPSTKPVMSLPS